jgi:hypothetical protein
VADARILPAIRPDVLAEYRIGLPYDRTVGRVVIGKGEVDDTAELRITRLDGSVYETFLGNLISVRPL